MRPHARFARCPPGSEGAPSWLLARVTAFGRPGAVDMHNGIKPEIAFIGGGNMASALMGGLLQNGRVPATVLVIEPDDRQRAKVALQFGVLALAVADALLAEVPLVVWAVKPQVFAAAARP